VRAHSQRNVELTRRVAEALNAGDVDALIAYCDPSIELDSVFAAVGGAVYHGHDGLREYFRDLEDTWVDDIRVEPEGICDLGEHTLGFSALRGRGRQSGAEVAMPLASVFSWRDGLMVYWKSYTDREDALRDLGVSEDQLQPIEP
jgi:ketosteroid isomerase-like protein